MLAALSEHTVKLIKISQLDSVFGIMSAVEEAIDAVFMHEIEKDLKIKGQQLNLYLYITNLTKALIGFGHFVYNSKIRR